MSEKKHAKPWSEAYNNINTHWYYDYGGGSGNGRGYYDSSSESSWGKRKHEYTPILLITSTVFNCKHCGVKKEEAKSEYCEDKKEDDYYDTGGW